jgi:hypothetical protein
MRRPQYPLNPAPTCKDCGRPCTLFRVNETNINGHIKRPYYSCTNHHESIFSTFDDSVDINEGNPPCKCGWTTRITKKNKSEDEGFYSCPVGRCGFNRGAVVVPSTMNGRMVGGPPPRNIGQRPVVEMGPRGDTMKPQGVLTEPAHREGCCGCAVM